MLLPLEIQVREAFPGEPDSAVALYRAARGKGRCFAGGSLGHMGILQRPLWLAIKCTGSAVNQRLALVNLHHDIHQWVFHRLEETQGMIKLLSRRHVVNRGL